MPSITKQTATGVQKAKGGVLGRVKSVSEIQRGLRMSLYGRPKTGKTRMACTFPKPLLIIGSEDGTASVVGIKGVDFVLLERCEEITELINGPVAEGKYKTVVLDNGTRFRDMRITEILGLAEMPVGKGWGFATREQWTECSNSIKEFLRPLFDVARRTVLNLVLIAQEQNYGDNSEGGASSDLITPNVSSALGKSLCDWVNAECDYVCQTLIREQTVTKQVKAGDVTTNMISKTGKKEYCLRVGPHEVYYTGFRLSNGRAIEQEFIVDPNYEKILKLINGK